MRARHFIVPVVVGSLVSFLLHTVGRQCFRHFWRPSLPADFWLLFWCLNCELLFSVFVGTFVAVLLYARKRAKDAHDNETRCRECGYILRGITEPRCPECGKAI